MHLPTVRYDKTNRSYYTRMNGKKTYLSRDPEQAHRKLADMLKGGPSGPPPLSVAGATAQWLAIYGSDWNKYLVQSWCNSYGAHVLAELTPDHPEEYARLLAKLPKHSPKTVIHKTQVCVRILKWARRRGCLGFEPEMPKLPKPVRRARDIDLPKLQAALAKLQPRARRLLTFILETGCRPSEARYLKWEEVDIPNCVCVLDEHKTAKSTGKERRIQLSPSAIDVLKQAYPSHDYVFVSREGTPYMKDGIRAILRRQGLKSVYALRHTFAQQFVNSGGSLTDLAALLGHQGMSMVALYAEVRSDRLKAVTAGLKSLSTPQPPSQSASD